MNIFTEEFKDIEDYYEAIDGVNIILTEKCNLRCQYCYQKIGNYSNVTMEDKTVDATARLISDIAKTKAKLFKRKNKEEERLIVVIIIGGETQLAKSQLLRLVKKIIVECNDPNIVKRISIATSSNGTIKPDLDFVEVVCKNFQNLSYQISIDGIPEIQENTRGFGLEEKRQTIPLIRETIKFLKENAPYENLQIHSHTAISKDTIPYLRKSFVYLWCELGILPKLYPVYDGGTSEQLIEILRWQLMEILYYIRNDKPLQKEMERQGDIIEKMLPFVCSSGLESVSIVPNGDIYNCDRFYYWRKTSDRPDIEETCEKAHYGNVMTDIDISKVEHLRKLVTEYPEHNIGSHFCVLRDKHCSGQFDEDQDRLLIMRQKMYVAEYAERINKYSVEFKERQDRQKIYNLADLITEILQILKKR